jgi:hypothetical protein
MEFLDTDKYKKWTCQLKFMCYELKMEFDPIFRKSHLLKNEMKKIMHEGKNITLIQVKALEDLIGVHACHNFMCELFNEA